MGLPLDSRSDYTKLDWVMWTATLTENREDFNALMLPVHSFLNKTPQRTPMTDWYFTSTARRVSFDARPVVGAVFLKFMYDKDIWNKYASKDKTQASGWAEMPIPPETVTLVPTSADTKTSYHYVTEEPSGEWYGSDYSVSQWKEAPGGLGTPGVSKTRWSSSEIWVRRNVEIKESVPEKVALRIWHDEDAVVYINGKKAMSLGGFTTGYEAYEFPATLLKSGENLVAIHVRQTTGGQFVDFGFDAIVPATK